MSVVLPRLLRSWPGPIAACLTLLTAATTPLQASFTFKGSGLNANGSLAASVVFDQVGSDLIVTLTNTSSRDVVVPIDVLTAVFFTIEGLPALTRVSAVLDDGSVVHFGTTDPGNVVGSEWAFKQAASGLPKLPDFTAGISSAGFDVVGPHDRFPGSNLHGPDSPGGLQYGITSAGDDPTTGNKPVTGKNVLIQNSVVFTLSGLGGFTLTADKIKEVRFQYGTALDEGDFPGTLSHAPAPPGLTLALASILPLTIGGFFWLRRRPVPASV